MKVHKGHKYELAIEVLQQAAADERMKAGVANEQRDVGTGYYTGRANELDKAIRYLHGQDMPNGVHGGSG